MFTQDEPWKRTRWWVEHRRHCATQSLVLSAKCTECLPFTYEGNCIDIDINCLLHLHLPSSRICRKKSSCFVCRNPCSASGRLVMARMFSASDCCVPSLVPSHWIKLNLLQSSCYGFFVRNSVVLIFQLNCWIFLKCQDVTCKTLRGRFLYFRAKIKTTTNKQNEMHVTPKQQNIWVEYCTLVLVNGAFLLAELKTK